MIMQGVPPVAGGRNVGLAMGEVFVLWLDQPQRNAQDQAVVQACWKAAEAYAYEMEKAQIIPAAVRPVGGGLPSWPRGPVVTLWPLMAEDCALRRASRVAMQVYCWETPLIAERIAWTRRLGLIGAAGMELRGAQAGVQPDTDLVADLRRQKVLARKAEETAGRVAQEEAELEAQRRAAAAALGNGEDEADVDEVREIEEGQSRIHWTPEEMKELGLPGAGEGLDAEALAAAEERRESEAKELAAAAEASEKALAARGDGGTGRRGAAAPAKVAAAAETSPVSEARPVAPKRSHHTKAKAGSGKAFGAKSGRGAAGEAGAGPAGTEVGRDGRCGEKGA